MTRHSQEPVVWRFCHRVRVPVPIDQAGLCVLEARNRLCCGCPIESALEKRAVLLSLDLMRADGNKETTQC